MSNEDLSPSLTRRQALAGGTATGLALIPSPAAASVPDLMADVETYAQFGGHETGLPGNLAALDWAERRLAGAGFSVRRQPVSYGVTRASQASILLEGAEIAGIFQQPSRLTGRAGVTAPLANWRDTRDDAAVAGRIAVVELPFARHSSVLEPRTARAIAGALRAGPAGLVLITDGPSGDALALNAPLEHALSTVPTLVIGPRDAAPLLAAARSGQPARLLLAGEATTVRADNLVAGREGRGRTIVVTTPFSGWFRCAAERGTGVAAFLQLARDLARRHPDAPLLFAGLVGHEREYVGGQRFLEALAPPPDQVRLWVHIGANFSGRDWHEAGPGMLLPLPAADSQRYLLAKREWIETIRPHLAGLVGFESPYPAEAANASGEARHFLQHGYTRMITNFGAHRLHHSARDLPQAVHGPALQASFAGWQRAIHAVLDGPAAA